MRNISQYKGSLRAINSLSKSILDGVELQDTSISGIDRDGNTVSFRHCYNSFESEINFLKKLIIEIEEGIKEVR